MGVVLELVNNLLFKHRDIRKFVAIGLSGRGRGRYLYQVSIFIVVYCVFGYGSLEMGYLSLCFVQQLVSMLFNIWAEWVSCQFGQVFGDSC